MKKKLLFIYLFFVVVNFYVMPKFSGQMQFIYKSSKYVREYY